MRITKTRTALVAMLSAAALTVAACGDGGGSGQDGGQGIAQNITIRAINDQTGESSYAGLGANRGAQLAVDEINEQGFLGDGVKIDFETVDSAGEIDRAVSEVTKTVADKNVSAILGPAMTQQAAAVAPVVEQQKVPTVFIQAGADGVVIGDYTFRATTPMEQYYDIATKWLAAQGLKNVSVIYNGTYPTFANLGEKVFPKLAAESGLKIDQSLQVQSTTQDFTGPAFQLAQAKPQAVVMFLIASQSVTLMKQLRQAGYTGQLVATSVQGAGNVAGAGAAADGLVYPVDFSAAMTDEASAKFTEAFKAKYNEEPDIYAAEGYDAMWWIARGIKASGDSSRQGIRDGLAKVAGEGFTGAMGDLKFEGNDLRVNGVMVQWRDGHESLIE